VSTVHRTRTTVKGPRPTLGVLVGDDGSAFALDTDYLVGREPEHDDVVQAGEMRPLKLVDAERSVSRVHAEVRLQDWDVVVVDRGSANGTFVAARGETEWQRLAADRGETIQPGTRVAFGKRVMTFDTHHQA
jgi:pSer/pThr/pTyr-binding forkhead associated (FHA) protein